MTQNHANMETEVWLPIIHVNSWAGLAATYNPSVQETGSHGKLAALAESESSEFSEPQLRS